MKATGASSTHKSTPSGTAATGAPSWATGSIRGRSVKCGERGKALTIRRINAKRPQNICSCVTYNKYGKRHCPQHQVEYDELYCQVLHKIRAAAAAALMDGGA